MGGQFSFRSFAVSNLLNNFYNDFLSFFLFPFWVSRIPDESTVDIPEECEFTVEEDTCSAKMVQKSDKTQECNPV